MNKKLLRKSKGKWITLSATMLAAVSGASLSNGVSSIHAQELTPVIEESETIINTNLTLEELPDQVSQVELEEATVPAFNEVVYEEEILAPVEAAEVNQIAEQEVPTESIIIEKQEAEIVPETTEESVEEVVADSTEETVVEDIEEPLEELTETSPIEESVEEVVVDSTEDTVVEDMEEPVEEVIESTSIEETVEEVVADSTEDTVIEDIEEPVEELAETSPIEESVEEVVDDSTEEAVVEDIEEPIDEVIESTPIEESVEEVVDDSTEDIVVEGIEEPIEELTETNPTKESAEEVVDDSTEEAVVEDIEESIDEVIESTPIEESVEEVLNDSTEDIVVEGIEEPIEEVIESTPIEESVEEVVDDSTEDTVVEGIEEPIEELTETNPTKESAEEVVDDSTEETVVEGIEEPIKTPTTEEPDEELVEELLVEKPAEELVEELIVEKPIVEPENNIEKHTVSQGDTLYSIANKSGVTVKQLRDWNNLSSNIIQPSTDLIVAQNTAATTNKDDQRRRETAKNITVNSGDTLYSIARRNNVSVADLKDWNSLTDNNIYSNQSLIISNTKEEKNVTKTKQTVNYAVQQGDTLYSIARRNNVSVSDLMDWNNLDGNIIKVNQQLTVSNQSHDELNEQNDKSKQSAYSVKTGDTLYSIAQRNGVTVNQIKGWNDITGNTILVNQQLTVSNQSDDSSENEGTSDKTSNYSTQRGDTLYSIAKRNNVTVSQLRGWNNLTGDTIYLNQSLVVDQGESDDKETTKPEESNDVELVTDSQAKSDMIQWFKDREGKTTYSMAYRNGPSSYDCSSAVFSALIHAGYLSEGTWLGNTETLFGLEGSLLIPISAEEVTAGDIFVNGVKGNSLGSGGHTGVALSNDSIIHSNYSDNGISSTAISGRTGSGPTFWYRLNEAMLKS